MSTFHAIVWLDRQEAHVIHFDRAHIEAQKIKSRLTHKASGAPGRGDLPSSSHSTKNGNEAYYHAVAESLQGVQEILITGPAQAKDEFKAHCARHDPAIDRAIVGVLTSDHPSEGQLVALARQYFTPYDRMQGQT